MQISIDHITTYRYTEPATGIVQKLRLTPRDNDHQQVVNWRIDVDADGRLVMAQDVGGAILGAVRADFFWGWGDEALASAGRTKQPLALWALWPAGQVPPAQAR